MRYITSLLLTAVFICFTTNARAQENRESPKVPDVKRTVVSFELRSMIDLSDYGTMQLPPELLSYFNDQNSLATLHVKMEAEEDQARISASYVFTNLQAYRQWREKSETKKFVQYLKDNNKNQYLVMSLTVSRMPLDELAEYNKQN